MKYHRQIRWADGLPSLTQARLFLGGFLIPLRTAGFLDRSKDVYSGFPPPRLGDALRYFDIVFWHICAPWKVFFVLSL